MKPTILSFVFIVLYHVSIAQMPITNNNVQSTNCPLMEVSINSNNHHGIIEVAYCNHGNSTAQNAYVEIEITNDLFITQSTIPVSSIIGDKYTFQLGDVNNSDCGQFYIQVPNTENRIHCTNIRIFPDDPCQAMIDRYIINNNGNDDDDDDGISAVTFSADMQYSVPGPPVLGQGGSNSVYEDHVFLNNIPTWDSLILVLANSGILPNTSTGNTSGTVTTVDVLNDITTLCSVEVCSNRSQGGGVILTDILSQNTTFVTTGQTVLGTTSNDNQTTTISSETTSDLQENKEVVVRLFPNPVSTTATITIDGANYQEIRLEVLDLAGKSVLSLQVNEQQNITLSRENLNQGVYFYRLIGDNASIHTGKFVVR